MSDTDGSDARTAGDTPADLTISAVETLGRGFRVFERHHFTMAGPDGRPHIYDRDVLRAGEVVAVLPVDLARREVVLIRQFRLPAHLATGKGELVEVVAGRIDPGESARDCALRECSEEIGLAPKRIAPLMTILIAPAFADEIMTLFVADVDARNVPQISGEEAEGEVIRPFRVSFDAALGLLHRGVVTCAPLIIALQWLELNRTRIEEVLASTPAVTETSPRR